MASVRPRGTERGASAEECYRIDESNRIPTAHHHQSNCIAARPCSRHTVTRSLLICSPLLMPLLCARHSTMRSTSPLPIVPATRDPARRATPPPVPILTEPPRQSVPRPRARERDGRRRGAQTTCAQTCDAKGKEEPGGGGRRARWNFFSSRISIYNRIYNHHGCYILVLDHSSLDSSLFLRNWLRNSPSKFLVSESSVCRPASCDVPHEKKGAFCMHRQLLESFPEKLNGR